MASSGQIGMLDLLGESSVGSGVRRVEALVSTDTNRTYKPDPRAYRLGMERLHLGRHEILFAAFAGWDAAGAKSSAAHLGAKGACPCSSRPKPPRTRPR